MKGMELPVLLVWALVVMLMTVSNVYAATTSDTTSVNLTIGNSAPRVSNVVTLTGQDLAQAGQKNISVNFTVNDADGIGDLNNATAFASVSGSTATIRWNSSCTPTTHNTTAINYTCYIAMWYFDDPGPWRINVSANDTAGLSASNGSETVTLNSLTGMTMTPDNVTFGTIPSGAVSGATNDPLYVINQGNTNITSFSCNATDLEGTGAIILASAFSMNDTDAVGTPLTNETIATLPWGNITRGNLTNESVYVYVNVPEGKSKTNYASRRNWIVAVT